MPSELAQSLRISITRIARQLRLQDPTGLSPTLASALASVTRHGEPTLSELAAMERVAPSTITAVVDRLESLGLATREQDQEDRRVSRVRATRAGTQHTRKVGDRHAAWVDVQLGSLNEDEIARLEAAVDVLRKLADGT